MCDLVIFLTDFDLDANRWKAVMQEVMFTVFFSLACNRLYLPKLHTSEVKLL